MRNGGNTFGPTAAIFEDCIFFCREFTEVIFEHFPREANMAADPLASKADGPLPAIWKEDPPDFLVDVILNDVSVFSNLI
jgi:hypothetical protein